MSEGSPHIEQLPPLQKELAAILHPKFPAETGLPRIVSSGEELKTDAMKQALPVEVAGKKTNAPDYMHPHLITFLTSSEQQAMDITPTEPLTPDQEVAVVKHLLEILPNDPDRMQQVLHHLPDLKKYNLPKVIMSLQVIGVDALQTIYQDTETTHTETLTYIPADTTFGSESRRQVYTRMGGLSDEITLKGSPMKVLRKEGDSVVMESTAAMDLRLAQSLFNVALPPQYLIALATLQKEVSAIDAKAHPTQRLAKAHELTLLRQKLYKAILIAFNVKPERSSIDITPPEKPAIDALATEITTRMSDVSRHGKRFEIMNIHDANRTSMQELVTYFLAGDNPTDEQRKQAEMFISDETIIEMYQNRHAGDSLTEAVEKTLVTPLFASLPPEKKILLRDMLTDRLRTEQSIGKIESYFQKHGQGLKPENISLSMYLPMGLKGTELLYRRTKSTEGKTKEEATEKKPAWIDPNIPVLELEQSPAAPPTKPDQPIPATPVIPDTEDKPDAVSPAPYKPDQQQTRSPYQPRPSISRTDVDSEIVTADDDTLPFEPPRKPKPFAPQDEKQETTPFAGNYYTGLTIEQLQEWVNKHPENDLQYKKRLTADGKTEWIDGEGKPVTRDISRERHVLKRYVDHLKEFNSQEYAYLEKLHKEPTMHPMHEDCRVAINIPAWMEGKNLYRVLEQYVQQVDKNGTKLNPNLFEINIIINRKTGTPADTSVAEIERFIHDAKARGETYHINYVDVEFDPPWNNVGNARKVLTDLTLLRSHNRTKQTGALYIESEDADLLTIDQKTVSNMITKYDEQPQLDALRGSQDRFPEQLMQNDYLFLDRRLGNFLELFLRKRKFRPEKNPKWDPTWNRVITGGWNTSYTAEAYALIGGYNPRAIMGEDMDIGKKITMLRGDGAVPNLDVVSTVGTRSDSSPRRYIAEILTGRNAYSDAFSDEELNTFIRTASLEELQDRITPVARIDASNEPSFTQMLDGYYRYFAKAFTPTEQDARQIFDSSMFWLGFKKGDYDYTENGGITIRNWTHIQQALESYRQRHPVPRAFGERPGHRSSTPVEDHETVQQEQREQFRFSPPPQEPYILVALQTSEQTQKYGEYVICFDKVLGKGYSGTVTAGYNEKTGQMHAFKRVNKHALAYVAENSGFPEGVIDAEDVVKNVTTHPTLLTYQDKIQTNGDEMYKVYPLAATDLDKHLLEKRLDATTATAITLDLVQAVAELHRHDLLHLAITPENILIDNQGRIALSDLESVLTRPAPDSPFMRSWGGGSYFSTPPELFHNNPILTPSTDTYQTSILFYRMLTGTYPYGDITASSQSQKQQLFEAHSNGVFTIPDTIPAPLQRILKKGIQPNPSDRYQTAAELLQDLKHAQTEIAVPPKQPNETVPTRESEGVPYYAASPRHEAKTVSEPVAPFLLDRYFSDIGAPIPPDSSEETPSLTLETIAGEQQAPDTKTPIELAENVLAAEPEAIVVLPQETRSLEQTLMQEFDLSKEETYALLFITYTKTLDAQLDTLPTDLMSQEQRTQVQHELQEGLTLQSMMHPALLEETQEGFSVKGKKLSDAAFRDIFFEKSRNRTFTPDNMLTSLNLLYSKGLSTQQAATLRSMLEHMPDSFLTQQPAATYYGIANAILAFGTQAQKQRIVEGLIQLATLPQETASPIATSPDTLIAATAEETQTGASTSETSVLEPATDVAEPAIPTALEPEKTTHAEQTIPTSEFTEKVPHPTQHISLIDNNDSSGMKLRSERVFVRESNQYIYLKGASSAYVQTNTGILYATENSSLHVEASTHTGDWLDVSNAASAYINPSEIAPQAVMALKNQDSMVFALSDTPGVPDLEIKFIHAKSSQLYTFRTLPSPADIEAATPQTAQQYRVLSIQGHTVVAVPAVNNQQQKAIALFELVTTETPEGKVEKHLVFVDGRKADDLAELARRVEVKTTRAITKETLEQVLSEPVWQELSFSDIGNVAPISDYAPKKNQEQKEQLPPASWEHNFTDVGTVQPASTWEHNVSDIGTVTPMRDYAPRKTETQHEQPQQKPAKEPEPVEATVSLPETTQAIESNPLEAIRWNEVDIVSPLERIAVWAVKARDSYPAHETYQERFFPTVPLEEQTRIIKIKNLLHDLYRKSIYILPEAVWQRNQEKAISTETHPAKREEQQGYLAEAVATRARTIATIQTTFTEYFSLLTSEEKEAATKTVAKALQTPITEQDAALLQEKHGEQIQRTIAPLVVTETIDIPGDIAANTTIEETIRHGAIGEVHLVYLQKSLREYGFQDVGIDQNKAAIKVLRESRKVQGSNALQEEAAILRTLRQQQQRLFPGSPSHFPEAQLTKYQGSQALLMERIDDTNITATLGKDMYTEASFINTARQYFEALATLHSLGWTCTDRKNTDLRFIPQQQRLVILDWNVVRNTAERSTPFKIDLMEGFDILLGYPSVRNNEKFKSFSEETLQKIAVLADTVAKSAEGTISAQNIREILNVLDTLSVDRIRDLEHLPLTTFENLVSSPGEETKTGNAETAMEATLDRAGKRFSDELFTGITDNREAMHQEEKALYDKLRKADKEGDPTKIAAIKTELMHFYMQQQPNWQQLEQEAIARLASATTHEALQDAREQVDIIRRAKVLATITEYAKEHGVSDEQAAEQLRNLG